MQPDLTAGLDQCASELRDRARRDGVTIDVDTARWIAIDSTRHACACAANDEQMDDIDRALVVGIAAYYAAQLATAIADDEARDVCVTTIQSFMRDVRGET